ncbi:MAG: hypothetical protein IKZ97_05040 [Butyrivibrio sp.]|nr:hypothetical protein [Butyrivibrio sp.]
MNQIRLDFPKGAFTEDSKVAITPVQLGSVADAEGRELSEFYQIVLPKGGVHRSFKVSIDYFGTVDLDKVIMLVESPKRERYTGVTKMHSKVLWTGHLEGSFYRYIWEMETTGDEQPFFIVGLVDRTLSLLPSTKATLYYCLDWSVPEKDSSWYEQYREDILTIIYSGVKELHNVLDYLALDYTGKIIDFFPYRITLIDDDIWAQHCIDKYCKNHGTIEINIRKLVKIAEQEDPYNSDLYQVFLKAFIHESIHWLLDMVYDPRTAYDVYQAGVDDWFMFSEALASWSERFTGDGTISEECPGNAEALITDFFCSNGKNYVNTGYGMGLFLDWLYSKDEGPDIILKILEYQQANGNLTTPATLKEAMKTVCYINNDPIFRPSNQWRDFMWSIMNKKIDERVDISGFGQEYSTTVKNDNTKIAAAKVYNYGMAVQRVNLADAMMQKLEDNPGLSMIYTQDDPDLVTMVCNSKMERIDSVTCGQPFVMSASKATADKYHYVVTYRKAQEVQSEVINNDMLQVEVKPLVKAVTMSIGQGEYVRELTWEDSIDSASTIDVATQAGGYSVTADNYQGSRVSFVIEKKGNLFGDAVRIRVAIDSLFSKEISLGRLKADSQYLDSERRKLITFKGEYLGYDIALQCWLQKDSKHAEKPGAFYIFVP